MKIFKLFRNFLEDVYENRYLVFQLTKSDYKNDYIGSYLGFIWTIIQPIMTIFVLWFVFAIGFKSGGGVEGVPFIAYLTVGFAVWNFFSLTISSSTKVFLQYSYLIKKINFKIAILPIVKIASELFTHIIFLFVAIAILLVSGVEFSLFWFQFVYYLFALCIFLLAWSWIGSSLQVFVKDISQFVKVVLNFGFWLTPIFWNIDKIPAQYQIYFKFNPVFYIVNGYRESFLYGRPFWNDLDWMIIFWGITLIMLVFSVLVFSRLRPHFSDVL